MNEATLQTIKLGVLYLILFTSYTSFQLIVTYIYENQSLDAAGPLNFIFNYLAFIISNILAPKCRMSFKKQMMIGTLGHGFNVSTGLVVPFISDPTLAYAYISLGGIVAGMSAGYLWVAQGGYLREAVKHQSNKGKFSGIFQLLYSLSSLFAGFITTFFLGFFSNQVYFIVLTVLALTSTLFCFLFFKDTKEEDQNEDQISNMSIKDSLLMTFKFMPKMWPILLMLVLDGLILGMYSNQVIRLIPKQQDKHVMDKKAGIVTIFCGLGSLLGGYLGGMLCDWIGLLKAGRFNIFFYLVAAAMTYLAIGGDMYWFVCLVSFIWGASYYFFESWIYVAILKLYNGRLEAFSINKIFHSISFAAFQTVILITDNQIDMSILIVFVSVMALPTFWCLSQQNYNHEQQNSIVDRKQQSLIIDDDSVQQDKDTSEKKYLECSKNK